MPAEMTEQTCSKCPKPLDTEGYPLFCKACRAKYQREYVAMKKEMSESRGFCAGISAMRALLVREFNAQGSGSFTGYEIAGLIAQCAGPAVEMSSAAAGKTTAEE